MKEGAISPPLRIDGISLQRMVARAVMQVQIHFVLTFYYFHWHKGSPIISDQGAYDKLTFWEQARKPHFHGSSFETGFFSLSAPLFHGRPWIAPEAEARTRCRWTWVCS